MEKLSKKEISIVNGAELSAADLTIYYWGYAGCKFIVSGLTNPQHVHPNPHPILTKICDFACFMGAKYSGDFARYLSDTRSTSSNATIIAKEEL